MDPTPSAHVDTFARDHLPPPDQWPVLLLDDPAPAYPARLNCGAELLDGTIERLGADRPAFHSGGLPPAPGAEPDRPPPPRRTWTYGELRATVDRLAHVLTGDLGVVPGNRVLLRGPTSPELAACWLAVMKAGAVAVTVLAAHRAGELATVCRLARISHARCATCGRRTNWSRRRYPGCAPACSAAVAPTTYCGWPPPGRTGSRRCPPRPTTWR